MMSGEMPQEAEDQRTDSPPDNNEAVQITDNDDLKEKHTKDEDHKTGEDEQSETQDSKRETEDNKEKTNDRKNEIEEKEDNKRRTEDMKQKTKDSKDEAENNHQGGGKARRVGTTVAPVSQTFQPHKRKISFADQKDQRVAFHVNDQPLHENELTDIDETSVPLTTPEKDEANSEEAKDKFGFLKVRESRFSTASRFSIGSRPSFSGLGLASRPSMASIKSAMTRVNSELYPERGSFVATSIGQSLAEMPQIAEKLYIITQVLAAISVSIGSMAVGYTGGYTGIALDSMTNSTTNTFNVSDSQKSWIVSLMPLSAVTGSLTGGFLINTFGRKMIILICGPPFVAGWALIGSAYNVWMLYIGRIICGLCVGLLTLSLPVYLGETIQPEIRGTLGLLPTTFGNAGILICFIAGSYIDWSILAYIGIAIPLLFFCMMIFVPETPRWYVSKGHLDNAERSLQWLRGSDNDVEFELEAIQANYESAIEETLSFRDLAKQRYWKPFLLSICLMIFQQLSGINAVINYTVQIFKLAGSSIDGHICTIIVGVVNLLATLAATALIDNLGRKILLLISSVAMIFSLFVLGTYFLLDDLGDEYAYIVDSIGWLPLVSLMIYVVAFSLGWGPIPWLFMGEALPAKVRGLAASIVTAFNWICSFVITKTFPDLLGIMGLNGVFFSYGVIMVFGVFFAMFLVPETKGKSLEEIETELAGGKVVNRQRRISEMSGIYIK